MLALSAAALVGACPAAALAQACPCSTPSVAKAVSQASAIFVGRVVAVTGNEIDQSRGTPREVWVVVVTMQVETLLKGNLEKVVVVLTPSICGYPLAAGGTYLVFAARNPSGLWTDACKGNASGQAVAVKAAEVRRVLGSHK
jgi:hypothetical protein